MSDLPNIYSQNTNSCDEEDPEFLFMADVIQHVRKSELDQEESNERSLITTEDVASSYENALINQGRLRKSAVELRTLMHQYSILENERGSLPFDAEFHREMKAYVERLEQFDNYISKCLVDDDEIADMHRRNARVTVLLKSIAAKEERRSTPLGTFDRLVRIPWSINYPLCLLDSAVNRHVRTVYDIAVGIQTAGIISKLLRWPFHGGWPWQWTPDFPLMVFFVGNWGVHLFAFAVGHRDLSTAFVLLQLASFLVYIWRQVFPNWWDYHWELSFGFPVGFLCYMVWHCLCRRKTF